MFFSGAESDHTEIFLGEQRAEAGGNGRVAGHIKRAAAVDGSAQLAQKGDTGGAGFDVGAHLFACSGFEAAVHVFGEIGEDLAAGFIGMKRLFSGSERRLACGFGAEAVHLLADAEPGAVETDADGAWLEAEDGCNLIGGELLHVMQDENHAQRWRNVEDGLVENHGLFGVEGVLFRSAGGVFQHAAEFGIAGKEFIEGKGLTGEFGALAPHTPASIAGDGVKPDGESLRVFELLEMGKGAVEDLLHGVLGIFRMAANLHAEGVNSVLKER
jgi:hypothetical protein